jgi:site-specific DNA-cytosine methylase
MTFKFVDLFAGVGGFHAVGSAFGGELAYASEIDTRAANIEEILKTMQTRQRFWFHHTTSCLQVSPVSRLANLGIKKAWKKPEVLYFGVSPELSKGVARASSY